MPDLPYVSKVIIDRWDNLSLAQQRYFIGYNAKQVAKAEAQAIVNAEQTQARKVRVDTETARARFARRLYKWLDFNDKKISGDEDGIVRHRAMVVEYEGLYGQTRTDYEKTYTAIRRGIEAERQRQENTAQSRLVTKERQERETREREERNAKLRTERSAAQGKRAASSTIRLNERRVPGYKRMLDRLYRSIQIDESRIADLTPKLEMEEYKKARHYRNLLAVLNTVHKRLEWRTKRRDYYQSKLSAAEDQIRLAREVLESND